MRPSILILLFAFAGCATQKHDAAVEQRGYDRGYQQAVKEQYWVIQNQQRVSAEPKSGGPTQS